MDHNSLNSTTIQEAPLFTFGLISDIQYADIDDGTSFLGDEQRYYRHSVKVLARAVEDWNKQNHAFALNLGDTLDGKNKGSLEALELLVSEFEKFNGSVRHVLGNHDFYNFDRVAYEKYYRIDKEKGYYDFSPCEGFRVIVLDQYMESIIGWPHNHPLSLNAFEKLRKFNKNQDPNSSHSLRGHKKRFVKFNGGLGQDQLDWLQQKLEECELKSEKVIIACHIPLHPSVSSHPSALSWDFQETIELIDNYSCVVGCFHGHDHGGGHFVNKKGVFFHTVEASLVAPPGSDSYAHVQVFSNRIKVIGVGIKKSFEIEFLRKRGDLKRKRSVI